MQACSGSTTSCLRAFRRKPGVEQTSVSLRSWWARQSYYSNAQSTWGRHCVRAFPDLRCWRFEVRDVSRVTTTGPRLHAGVAEISLKQGPLHWMGRIPPAVPERCCRCAPDTAALWDLVWAIFAFGLQACLSQAVSAASACEAVCIQWQGLDVLSLESVGALIM